ncbi:hypothetical protein HHK36_010407 [Tetracentron sinense]|uniref:Expansin-like A2 n=1 Tax=Tetracentron sinense TaxID=13715 RepID=A0A834ZE77_TETSI|nr:hypothetical protein HHK36_010407 [Tetracentron sinense]
MALFLCFLIFLISSATACDRCVHDTEAAYFHSSSALSSGACGYGSLALGMNGGYLAGAVSSLYKEGAGCGGCFQLRCMNTTLCSRKGTKVVLTDLNNDNKIEFVLSRRAFKAMANKGMSQEILKPWFVDDMEYKRVPCEYKDQNLAVRVEEFSQKAQNYIAIKFLYQGGQTEIVGVDVAQVGSSDWVSMRRNYGAVWDASQVPAGPLQFRLVVTAGYDRKFVRAQNVLPADWNTGVIYDSGIQVSDIAQERCSPCDGGDWK